MYMLAADNLNNVDAVDAQPSVLGGPVLYRPMCDRGRLHCLGLDSRGPLSRKAVATPFGCLLSFRQSLTVRQIESECVSIVTGMILASVIVEPTASGAHTSLYLLHC